MNEDSVVSDTTSIGAAIGFEGVSARTAVMISESTYRPATVFALIWILIQSTTPDAVGRSVIVNTLISGFKSRSVSCTY